MPPTSLSKPALPKADAERIVKRIVEEKATEYKVIPFNEYQKGLQGSFMRSQQYKPYYVLVYPNSKFHAGWLVCPYVINGYCEVKCGLLELNPKKGGTNRFGIHIDAHAKARGLEPVSRPLQERCRTDISEAAARAVMLDLRPFSFAESHEGMACYAEAVFKAGQTVPHGVPINRASYLPSHIAVKNALSRLVSAQKTKFTKLFHETYNGLGGAITIDGVHLKVQGKHYYDFTVHHIDIVRANPFLDKPEFNMKTTTVLFVEGPTVGNAVNIRGLLDTNLQREYGTSFDSIQKNFTIVTDGAAVMACVAGSSVSRNIAPLDQTWMRCFVHVLNNVMKDTMENCVTDEILVKISQDFKAMKRIVTHSKKNGWNSMMPAGHRLIQEIETRFGTYFLVADRFLKSASKVWNVIRAQNYAAAINSFESIKTTPENIVIYPTIEAIVDAFRPVYDATVDFQKSNEPMLHKILPAIQHITTELSKIEHGLSVRRDDNCVHRPSLYSMRLSGAMKVEIQKIEIHDLWLVACFLYPYLRDMNFWANEIEREDFKKRAEALTRKMCMDGGPESSQSGLVSQANPTNNRNDDLISTEPASKKRRFSLHDHVSRGNFVFENADEVSTYKSMSLGQMRVNQDEFLEKPFSVVSFWYKRRSDFPKLYKIALRVFATPASSCSSERVFSTLKKIVTTERSMLKPENISDIIVGRSLMII